MLACPERAPEFDVVDTRAALTPLAIRVLGVVVTPDDGSAMPDPPEPAAHKAVPIPEPDDARDPEVGPPASLLEPRDAGLALAGIEASAAASKNTSIAESEAREVIEGLRAAGRPLTAAELRAALGDPLPPAYAQAFGASSCGARSCAKAKAGGAILTSTPTQSDSRASRPPR